MERVADGVYQIKKGFRAFLIDGDEGLACLTGREASSSSATRHLTRVGL